MSDPRAAAVFCLVGILCLLGGIGHELAWLARIRWKWVPGTITDVFVSADGDTFSKKIEYLDPRGEVRHLTSAYSSSTRPAPGTRVTVVVDPVTGIAEPVSGLSRVMWTVVPLLFGAVFLAYGLRSIH